MPAGQFVVVALTVSLITVPAVVAAKTGHAEHAPMRRTNAGSQERLTITFPPFGGAYLT